MERTPPPQSAGFLPERHVVVVEIDHERIHHVDRKHLMSEETDERIGGDLKKIGSFLGSQSDQKFCGTLVNQYMGK